MPTLRNSKGEEFQVSDVDAVRMRGDDPSLQIVGDVQVSPDEFGSAPVAMAAGQVTSQEGKAPASAGEQAAYAHREYLKDKTSLPGAIARQGLGGLTFGVSDKLFDADALEADRVHHGAVSTAAGIAGALLPAAFGDEAGLVSILREPASAERAAASLSSKFLYGGELGGELGTAGKAVERGLTRAGGAVDNYKNALQVGEDLAGLDAKGLKAARETELGNIEAARVPQRQAAAAELDAFRATMKNENKLYLAFKDIKEASLPADAAEGSLKIQEIGKINFEADKAADRLLRNPIALAEKPDRALGVLQQQENALLQLQKREPTLRNIFAADTSGERAAALDSVPGAIERNRALQQQIRAMTAEPASARLSAIESAQDVLKQPAASKSLLEDMLGGTIMGHVAGALSGLPVIGPAIGAKAGRLVSDVVFGRIGKAVGESSARTAKAVEAFLGSVKASPAVPILATKVLSNIGYAPGGKEPRASSKDLAAAFKARADEIKAQTAYGPDGTPVMRPEARAAVAARLAPIRSVDPLGADRLETIAARRIEFLSSKIPRRPDLPIVPGGVDHWRPSDMEMRRFARYAHAVEDPHGVEERLAHGSVSPEDAEAYKAVYPERFAALQQEIITKLPLLQKTLPYSRRLSLSIFTGIAVDPSLHPAVLAVLQGQFAGEDGSDGGTQAPKPSPQFGSVHADIGTAAQQREARMQ